LELGQRPLECVSSVHELNLSLFESARENQSRQRIGFNHVHLLKSIEKILWNGVAGAAAKQNQFRGFWIPRLEPRLHLMTKRAPQGSGEAQRQIMIEESTGGKNEPHCHRHLLIFMRPVACCAAQRREA